MAFTRIHVVCLILILIFSKTECHECKPGYYGHECTNQCGQCAGGSIFCDSSSGYCINGCALGYKGDTCSEQCPPGTFGSSCSQKCSTRCQDPVCNYISGDCSIRGCKPGYHGNDCTQECPLDRYGEGCRRQCDCAAACGCDPVDGTCYPPEKCHSLDPNADKGKSMWKRADNDTLAKPGDTDKPGANNTLPKTPDDQKPNTDPSKDTHGKDANNAGTQMMCSKLEKEFSDLKEKLNNKVDIPLWPLVALLLITALIMISWGIWDIIKQYRREVYMAKWEKENLDKTLQEAAMLTNNWE